MQFLPAEQRNDQRRWNLAHTAIVNRSLWKSVFDSRAIYYDD